MPKLRNALLVCGATLLFAGAAFAAAEKFHTMKVDLPDGSVAHITYAGDVAPKVAIEQTDARAAVAYDPFAEMDRQMAAMQQQVADMQHTAAASAHAGASDQPHVVMTGTLPAGSTYSYTMVSTTGVGGKGSCTQTVEWRSDGKDPQPKMTQASSGDCDAIKMKDAPVPAATPAKPAKPDPRSI